MYPVFCILYFVSCILYPVSCILNPISCVLYSVFCILNSVFCILYSVFCILYSVFCIRKKKCVEWDVRNRLIWVGECLHFIFYIFYNLEMFSRYLCTNTLVWRMINLTQVVKYFLWEKNICSVL